MDGMDISLCSLNLNTNELKWAGANNPLLIVRNKKITELKPLKQSIGKIDNPLPYPTETFTLQKNDSVYFFTDGYADQFGGEKGKKFKYSKLQELLITNSVLSLDKQEYLLDQTFNNWKGNLEQVDDILIIGIKI
jgi:serine phosphatase RsbU (regulator of sigma subunit)